jgi:hypothetical protein
VDARAARKKAAPTIRLYFSLLKLWKSVTMQNITQGNAISQKQMMGNFCGQIGDEPASEL